MMPPPRPRLQSPPNRCRAILLGGVLACALPSMASAQDAPPGQRPASAGRVVRAFDFEEQGYNTLPVPLGWIRAQDDPDVPRTRPGFPIWNGATLDYASPAYSGIGSVKLPTRGGSTSLILRRGEINVFPNADYLVSARLRTSGLAHAKARVVARLIDQHGQEIKAARTATPLVSTGGAWEQVSLEIEGLYPDAAFVQIELELLQPEQQDAQRAGAFTVWEQDFDGAAWFDNLIIAQLPRLEISTGRPGNIVESDAPPPLQILVRDLTGDAIAASARVFDVHGRQVDFKRFDDDQPRVETDWSPRLPGFGWYRAMLQVLVDGQLVGNRTLDFIWASPSTGDADSGIFGIHADLTDPRIARSAPSLIGGAGVTRASIEVWNYATKPADIEPGAPTMAALDELLDLGTRLRIELSEIPAELADALAVDPHEVVPVFAGPSSDWVGWGSSMLDEYGQAVAHWRFGSRATEEPPSALNPELDTIRGALIGYVPGPILVTPWAIDRPIDPGMVRENNELLILDNDATGEDSIELVVDDWIRALPASSPATPSPPATPGDHPPSLGMTLSPEHANGEWTGIEIWSSVSVMARKAIAFWWATSIGGVAPDRVDLELDDAWWVSPGKRGQVMPAPELVVWRTLASHLGDRRAVEALDLIPGVRMLLASRAGDADSDPAAQDSGTMILWRDEPGNDPITLSMPLSTDAVTRIDVFNNATRVPLEPTGSLRLPAHRIEIGRSPIIVEGVNIELVRFLSAIKLDPDRLQARSGVHKHALMLSNPWPYAVRGRVFIVEPGGYSRSADAIDRAWEISPRVIPFVLDAGEERRIPIDIAYSLGELAGEKKLTFDVELQADKDYPLMRVERRIELGLDGIDMTLTARTTRDGLTIVGVLVSNRLDTQQDFEIIAIPPNEARLRRSLNAIKPGEHITREFALRSAEPGDEIIVSLLLRGSSTRLNKSVKVP